MFKVLMKSVSKVKKIKQNENIYLRITLYLLRDYFFKKVDDASKFCNC